MKIVEIINESSLFGPIYHRTNADIDSFKQFDLSKSKPTMWSPAIYATFGDSSWEPGHLKGGKTLKGYVAGKIFDATRPSSPEEIADISKLLGRQVDDVPFITLERRFGSIAKALQLAGYAAVIHQGPGRTGKHIAIFDPASIVE